MKSSKRWGGEANSRASSIPRLNPASELESTMGSRVAVGTTKKLGLKKAKPESGANRVNDDAMTLLDTIRAFRRSTHKQRRPAKLVGEVEDKHIDVISTTKAKFGGQDVTGDHYSVSSDEDLGQFLRRKRKSKHLNDLLRGREPTPDRQDGRLQPRKQAPNRTGHDARGDNKRSPKPAAVVQLTSQVEYRDLGVHERLAGLSNCVTTLKIRGRVEQCESEVLAAACRPVSGWHSCADAKNCRSACVAKMVAPNLDRMCDWELVQWYEEVMGEKFVSRKGEKVRGRIRRVIRAEAKRGAAAAAAAVNGNSSSGLQGGWDCSPTLEASTSSVELVIDLSQSHPACEVPASVGAREEMMIDLPDNAVCKFPAFEAKEKDTYLPDSPVCEFLASGVVKEKKIDFPAIPVCEFPASLGANEEKEICLPDSPICEFPASTVGAEKEKIDLPDSPGFDFPSSGGAKEKEIYNSIFEFPASIIGAKEKEIYNSVSEFPASIIRAKEEVYIPDSPVYECSASIVGANEEIHFPDNPVCEVPAFIRVKEDTLCVFNSESSFDENVEELGSSPNFTEVSEGETLVKDRELHVGLSTDEVLGLKKCEKIECAHSKDHAAAVDIVKEKSISSDAVAEVVAHEMEGTALLDMRVAGGQQFDNFIKAAHIESPKLQSSLLSTDYHILAHCHVLGGQMDSNELECRAEEVHLIGSGADEDGPLRMEPGSHVISLAGEGTLCSSAHFRDSSQACEASSSELQHGVHFEASALDNDRNPHGALEKVEEEMDPSSSDDNAISENHISGFASPAMENDSKREDAVLEDATRSECQAVDNISNNSPIREACVYCTDESQKTAVFYGVLQEWIEKDTKVVSTKWEMGQHVEDCSTSEAHQIAAVFGVLQERGEETIKEVPMTLKTVQQMVVNCSSSESQTASFLGYLERRKEETTAELTMNSEIGQLVVVEDCITSESPQTAVFLGDLLERKEESTEEVPVELETGQKVVEDCSATESQKTPTVLGDPHEQNELSNEEEVPMNLDNGEQVEEDCSVFESQKNTAVFVDLPKWTEKTTEEAQTNFETVKQVREDYSTAMSQRSPVVLGDHQERIEESTEEVPMSLNTGQQVEDDCSTFESHHPPVYRNHQLELVQTIAEVGHVQTSGQDSSQQPQVCLDQVFRVETTSEAQEMSLPDDSQQPSSSTPEVPDRSYKTVTQDQLAKEMDGTMDMSNIAHDGAGVPFFHPSSMTGKALGNQFVVCDSEDIIGFQTSLVDDDDTDDRVLSLEEYVAGHRVEESTALELAEDVTMRDLEEDDSAQMEEGVSQQVGQGDSMHGFGKRSDTQQMLENVVCQQQKEQLQPEGEDLQQIQVAGVQDTEDCNPPSMEKESASELIQEDSTRHDLDVEISIEALEEELTTQGNAEWVGTAGGVTVLLEEYGRRNQGEGDQVNDLPVQDLEEGIVGQETEGEGALPKTIADGSSLVFERGLAVQDNSGDVMYQQMQGEAALQESQGYGEEKEGPCDIEEGAFPQMEDAGASQPLQKDGSEHESDEEFAAQQLEDGPTFQQTQREAIELALPHLQDDVVARQLADDDALQELEEEPAVNKIAEVSESPMASPEPIEHLVEDFSLQQMEDFAAAAAHKLEEEDADDDGVEEDAAAHELEEDAAAHELEEVAASQPLDIQAGNVSPSFLRDHLMGVVEENNLCEEVAEDDAADYPLILSQPRICKMSQESCENFMNEAVPLAAPSVGSRRITRSYLKLEKGIRAVEEKMEKSTTRSFLKLEKGIQVAEEKLERSNTKFRRITRAVEGKLERSTPSTFRRITRAFFKLEKDTHKTEEEKLASTTQLASPQAQVIEAAPEDSLYSCASDWDLPAVEKEYGACPTTQKSPAAGRLCLLTDSNFDQIDNFIKYGTFQEEWQDADKILDPTEIPFLDELVAEYSPKKRKSCDSEHDVDRTKRIGLEKHLQVNDAHGKRIQDTPYETVPEICSMDDEHVPTALSKALIESNGERRGPIVVDGVSRFTDQVLVGELQYAQQRLDLVIEREQRVIVPLQQSLECSLAGSSDPLSNGQHAHAHCDKLKPNSNCHPVKGGEPDACVDLLACEQPGGDESLQNFEPPSKLPHRRKAMSPLSQLELMRASGSDSPSSSESSPEKIPPFRFKKPAGHASHNEGSSQLAHRSSDGCSHLEPTNLFGNHEAGDGFTLSLDSSDEDANSCDRQGHGSRSCGEEPAGNLSRMAPSSQSISSNSNQNISSQEASHSQPTHALSKGILKIGPKPCKGVCNCAKCMESRTKAGRASDFIASQMKAFQSIAVRLTKEVQGLRTLIENNLKNPGETEKVTLKKSRDVEEAADKDLVEILRDSKRIHQLTATKPSPRRKTIVFADEAGKKLCHVKTFQSQSLPKSILDSL